MNVGNRVIFDQNGTILTQTYERSGDVPPLEPISLDYVDLDFGVIDYSRYTLVSIDVETKQPVLKEIEKIATEKDRIKELEDQILLMEDEKNGGIL